MKCCVFQCLQTDRATRSEQETGAPNKLLAGLTRPQRIDAETIGEVREFAKDHVIFHEGQPGDCLYVVVRGSVAITKSAESGRQQLLGAVEAGDFFGEMSVVDAQRRSAQAVAREPSVLRILRRSDLDRLVAINPQVMFNLLASVSERLRSMNVQYIDQIVRKEKLTLVGQMARSIIHDFKNPMSVIMLQAELIGRDPRHENGANTIIRHVERLTRMANELLDFSRGNVQLHREWIDPQTWVDDLVGLITPLAEENGIKIVCDVSCRDRLWVDPVKLGQAIYNLSANAIEAMTAGGSLSLRVGRTGNDWDIQLADTGPGIPEAIRDKLFDPFVSHGKRTGTGLGTSIARKAAEDHGGRISFETETGVGTTFHIRLPVTQP